MEDLGERLRKSVARKAPVVEERVPFAWDLGQRVGTTAWIAFRLMCSPVLS